MSLAATKIVGFPFKRDDLLPKELPLLFAQPRRS